MVTLRHYRALQSTVEKHLHQQVDAVYCMIKCTHSWILRHFLELFNNRNAMSSAKIFSLEGKGLRLDTAADVEPHIKELRDNNEVEELRLGGNTLGVEACEALAKVLETKKTLQVSYFSVYLKQDKRYTVGLAGGCTVTDALLSY